MRNAPLSAGLARSLRATSKPSIPGRPMSRSTTSGRNSEAAETASGPVKAVFVTWPRRVWRVARLRAESLLSSTMRMRRRVSRSTHASGVPREGREGGGGRWMFGENGKANDKFCSLAEALAAGFDAAAVQFYEPLHEG